MKIRSECQDGGLWLIYVQAKDKACTVTNLGYVWNEGYTREERKGLPYKACLGWDSCVPTEVIGESPTFMGAVKLLKAHGKPEVEPVIAAIRKKRAGVHRIAVSFPEERAVQFVRSVANCHADSIWQPDWHVMRSQAQSIQDML